MNEEETGIGTKESSKLGPAKVLVESVIFEEIQIGSKKSKKLVCICSHPDSQDDVRISSVKYEDKGELKESGLWLNYDGDGLIQKGSALAHFLVFSGAKKASGLLGSQLMTVLDSKGYLTFKAY